MKLNSSPLERHYFPFNGVLLPREKFGATFGISLSKEGISTTLMGEFQADSYAGKAAAAMKNSNASFTAGLPQGKYFMYGGFVVDQASIQLMNDFVAPIEKEIANLGAEAKPLQEYVASMKDYLSAAKQANFGSANLRNELP